MFTEDLIQTWIDYKREKELDAIRLRPHPYEFYLYYESHRCPSSVVLDGACTTFSRNGS